MNIRAMGAELFIADRRTSRYDRANSPAPRNFANEPKMY